MEVGRFLVNDLEVIREHIEKMGNVNSINNYFEYLNSSNPRGFELSFVSELKKNKMILIKEVLDYNLSKLSKEELVKTLSDYIVDGDLYSFEHMDCDEEMADHLSYYVSERQFNDIAKTHMIKILDKLVLKAESDIIEYKKNSLDSEIQILKNTINNNKEKLDKLEEELSSLNGAKDA